MADTFNVTLYQYMWKLSRLFKMLARSHDMLHNNVEKQYILAICFE